MSALWRRLGYEVRAGAANMALDAAILAAVEAGEVPPTLRVYGFAPPALSIGHGQAEAEVDLDACRRMGVDVVRRPTGGRAVLHEAELTYALVAPADDPRFPPTVPGTYQVVAEALRDALAALGVREVALAPRRAAAATDPACFGAPSRAELLVANRKVAGSAQRRTRRAFLQHGSILLDPDPARLAACLRGADPAALAATMIGLREALGGRAVGPDTVAAALEAALGARLGVRFVPGCLAPREEAVLAA